MQAFAQRISRMASDINMMMDELTRLSTFQTFGEPESDCRSYEEGEYLIGRNLTCRRLYQIRRKRDELLGADLFGECAWDMLLDLYQAEMEGYEVTVVSLCAAAMVPQTSGIRTIKSLVERNLVTKRADSNDRRRALVALTLNGIFLMDELFSQINRISK